MRDDPTVTELVTRARTGDKQAWDAIVERYAPLIWSICRRHSLADADADDVGQSVWLQLADQLDRLHDPAALPGWLATTSRRECGRVLRASRGPGAAGHALDAETVPDDQARMAEQELLQAERHAALREAFTHLPPGCRQLIAMLIQDPPVPYATISARLGIPVGSIGPNRARCLDKLRRYPAIAALINAEAESAGSEQSGQARKPSNDHSIAAQRCRCDTGNPSRLTAGTIHVFERLGREACGCPVRAGRAAELAVLCRSRATATPSTGRCIVGARRDLAKRQRSTARTHCDGRRLAACWCKSAGHRSCAREGFRSLCAA